jgi:DNA-binding response OmpR family regulator
MHRSAVVLVADDSPVNLDILTEILSGQDFSVMVATDGQMVLEQVSRELPDLVLLDAMMPRMNGFEVCRVLKADAATRDIPVIFTTALADPSDRVRGLELGAVDYVTKPFEQTELLLRVKTQLNLRAATLALVEKNAALELAQEELRRGRDTLELEVARRTEELRKAMARLEHELNERQRAEAERTGLQEQIIAAQAARLAELSTPIIPITDRILVMPLIGLMDEERAERVLEAALQHAMAASAEAMILDITGVPRADHAVAEMILKTARALRLIGARTILTGIRADVARTLVALDIDFTEIITQSTLQGAISYVLRELPTRRL